MDSIDAALADLALQNTPNYTATAKKYNVVRSTLSRRHRDVTASLGSNGNGPQLLSEEQTKGLINYINQLTDRGLSSINAMVRTFARDISEKWSGKNWVYNFIKFKKNSLTSGFLNEADLCRKKADNVY